ncbi:hypothetical protein WMZ97_06115 [Lentibacillus sp. N15]|uniref:hypothetical protein n=1 Tax=Lentibacillus songyuanensis TaxID=3136161 RepID=UPI0031B9D90B
MVRLGLYGKYKGIEYKVTRDMQGNRKIITEDAGKIDGSFQDTYNSGVFSKIIDPNELSDCVSVKTFGIIKGKKVQVLKESETEYQVATSSLLIGSELKIPRIDRDQWLGWVPKSEVKIVEEKKTINPADL